MKLNGEKVTKEWLAKRLEHVIWDNDERIITEEVTKGVEYGFGVIFSPGHHWHNFVHDLLKGSGVVMSTPINFKDGLMPASGAAAQAAEAFKGGCRSIDLYPDMAAWKMKKWEDMAEYVKTVRESFPEGDIKVLTFCNDTEDDIKYMAEAIKKGGGTYIKAYDYNKQGAPMHRIKMVRALADEYGLGLKASGNGKYWTTAILMGAYAAGADCVSASNTFEIVDNLPIFEELYSKYEF
ncbi:MAG: hypothetical protein HFI37_08615 [Lachnospiraceae bacterium]|jgi:deoxyribose-phosphate aldolase|nr:hypothetical protein [Lachnospiraceae bacterium]